MGYAKNKSMEIDRRRYGESDKYVCRCCIKNSYLKKMIAKHGEMGTCSFCKKENGENKRRHIVCSLEKLMEFIVLMIDDSYVSADGNLPWDDETGEYMGITYDQYDFVHGPLVEMLQCENSELLSELVKVLEDDVRTRY